MSFRNVQFKVRGPGLMPSYPWRRKEQKGDMRSAPALSAGEHAFHVVGSDKEYQVNGKRVLGRKTPGHH